MPSPSLGQALERARDEHQLAIRQGRDADAVSALRAAVIVAHQNYVNSQNEAETNTTPGGRLVGGGPTSGFAPSDRGAGWSYFVGQ